MKLRLRDIKKALYLASVLAFLVSIHVASVYVFAVHRFSVFYDPLLSSKAEQKIDAFIRETALYSLRKPSEIAQRLQEEFPFISCVTCRYRPECVHISLQAYSPSFQLNSDEIGCDMIVMQNNWYVPADYFETYVYAQKPNLKIITENTDEQLPSDVFAYLASIDQTLLTQGSVDWRHRNEIVFQLAHMPVRLICNYRHKVTQQLLEQCGQIVAEVVQKPLFKSGISADVRFDDRIIVSKLKS